MAASDTSPKRFLGWRILFFGIITTALSSPGQTIAVSVFTDHLIRDIDITRSQVSFAYLAGTIGGGLFLPYIGRRIDKIGTKRSLAIIGTGFGFALMAMGQIQTFPFLIVGFFAIRLLGQGSIPLIANVSLTHWFDRRRGTMMGILAAASGALMGLAPVLFNTGIDAWGWRIAWPASGLIVIIVLVPMARWGLVDRPTDVGQHPDGADHVEAAEVAAAAGASMTRSQAMRTFRFWVLVANGSAVAMLSTAVNFHQIDLLGDAGLTAKEAALMFLPQTYGAIVVGLVYGYLADRFPARFLVPTAMAMLAAALGLATIVAPGWSVVAYALVLGSATSAVRSINSTVMPRWFGVVHIGAIRGVSGSVGVFMSALGPFLFSELREAMGSYSPVTALSAIFPIAVLIAGLFLPSREEAARLLAATGS
jgi:MFS family permease